MSLHIVHKQKVNIQIPAQEEAHSFQSRISYLLQHKLPQKMEAVFDKFVPPNQIIRIEQLHLDLKTISPENFEKEFEERFIKELQEAVSKIKNDAREKKNIVAISKSESLLHSFIHFLQYGYLAWYDSVKQIRSWEEGILNHLSVKEWEYFLNWLQQNYKLHAQILKRLILQFSDNFLQQLLLKTNVYVNDSLNEIYEDLNFILTILPEQEISRKRIILWESIFNTLLELEKNSGGDTKFYKHSFIIKTL